MGPLFFHDGDIISGSNISLNDDTARHVVQVLRMQPGDSFMLTNGKGLHAGVTIASASKKACTVEVHEVRTAERRHPLLHLGVAFTKNSSRNEWILEKATELGVATIIPLQSHRSEREKFRYDRWQNILVSAMLQSQQYYLPRLAELTPVLQLESIIQDAPQKLLAHCIDDVARESISIAMQKDKETLLLIGPEGDFTAEEVNNLTSKSFAGISMGTTRLRTETAAVTAVAFFNMLNHG